MRISGIGLALCLAWAGPGVSDCLAETCVECTDGATVCVDWSEQGNPTEETDFAVSCSDPDNPDVTFLTDSLTWEIWSVDGQDPGNLGDVAIHPGETTDAYGIRIINGSDPGADDVGSIDLSADNWAGHSSLNGGKIAGDLNGNLVVVEDASGNGGTMGTFEIGGHFLGSYIDMYKLTGVLSIKGDLRGDLTTDYMVNLAQVWVYGHVTENVTIDIGEMESYTFLFLNWTAGHHTYGDVVLGNGVPSGCALSIGGDLTSTGSIDLNGYSIGFNSVLSIDGDLDGDILNVGTVVNRIAVGGDVGSSGQIEVEYDVTGSRCTNGIDIDGDLAGSITVGDDVTGTIDVAGNIMSTGEILISDDLSGDVTVHDDVAGEIEVADDIMSTGEIKVGGSLLSTGTLTVDSLCDGLITIDEETVAGSLIHCADGLADDGIITVNYDGGEYDANGDIHIGHCNYSGQPPLPAVTFDGYILIQKAVRTEKGGWLEGSLWMYGCHATDDDLDICLCGGGDENVTITQANCRYQVDWDCGDVNRCN
jgi:hypothetical protein